MMAREFRLIAEYFRPLAGAAGRGLQDDAAVLAVPPERELVISADVMNEGVHYLAGTAPDLIARKLLRVNLSDLAAMGAAPLGYMLTLAVPRATPDAWFAGFAEGLRQDQAAFGLTLLGGDSTSIDGPASVSVTILGTVARGQAIGRGGARPGDGLWVSGTIGDAALGLAAAQGKLADPTGYLRERYELPLPRLGLIEGLATAAVDISDGLFPDIGHLVRASLCGVEMDDAAVPLSEAVVAAGAAWRDLALAGGDDYEVAFTLPAGAEAALTARAQALGVAVSRIGVVTEPGRGRAVLPASGWSHFG